MTNWSRPNNPAHAFRLDTLRRRHNERRQAAVKERRARIARLVAEYGDRRGIVARLSRELDCSHPTIVRDLKAIRAARGACPACGHPQDSVLQPRG